MILPTFEISKRVVSGQRSKFDFVEQLPEMTQRNPKRLVAQTRGVGILVVSRQEGSLYNSAKPEVIKNKERMEVEKLFDLKHAKVAHDVSGVMLGEIKVIPLGLGSVALGPVVSGTPYPIGIERQVTLDRLAELYDQRIELEDPSSILCLATYNGLATDLDDAVAYAAERIPKHTLLYPSGPRLGTVALR
jgi:hypothetical protein